MRMLTDDYLELQCGLCSRGIELTGTLVTLGTMGHACPECLSEVAQLVGQHNNGRPVSTAPIIPKYATRAPQSATIIDLDRFRASR